MLLIEQEFLKAEREHAWNAMFRKLENDPRLRTSAKKTEVALLNSNQRLNRFLDVLPYDDTRVRLLQGTNDYINASYIHVPEADRKYIVTQGPLEATSSHFWQMVWEQNTRVIVMLTHLIEKGCKKCCLYYPDSQDGSEMKFDDVDLKVTFVSDQQFRHYTQRKLGLTHLITGEYRQIIHWSDFDWPDHGAPNNSEPFLQLLGDVRRCGAFDPRYGPLVVHCSAGIGRSGTFLLVDSILKLLACAEKPGDISLTNVLASIRTQRHGLVQTIEQLRFSYVAVIAGFKILAKLEQDERSFVECSFSLSGESDGEEAEEKLPEKVVNSKFYPKVCGRQDNVMPSGRLSEVFEDINCALIKRVDSTASNFQPSPKTSRHLVASPESQLPTEDSSQHSLLSTITTRNDRETSLRLRQERLVRNEAIAKKIDDIKTKLHQQNSSALSVDNQMSVWQPMTKQCHRVVFMGLLVIFAGSFIWYKYTSSNA